jgi:hypothetical protein
MKSRKVNIPGADKGLYGMDLIQLGTKVVLDYRDTSQIQPTTFPNLNYVPPSGVVQTLIGLNSSNEFFISGEEN